MNAQAAQLLEPYRKYLELLAELHFDRRLRGKLDPADVVQQAMLRAYSAFDELRGVDPPLVEAWLRKILSRTLVDVARHYGRDRRDVDLEKSLRTDLDRSASGFAAWAVADQTSPSGRAEKNEDLLRLADALAELPEPMREVVILKHCRGLTLSEIARRLDKTVPSVASYLRRGLEQLRRSLS